MKQFYKNYKEYLEWIEALREVHVKQGKFLIMSPTLEGFMMWYEKHKLKI